MGLQFHETMYGKNFFEHQLPRLTKAIEKLADQNNKQETVPSYPFQLANEEPRQRLLAVMDDPEKAEAFARTFHEQFMTDGDSFASIGFHMARAILNNNIEEFLVVTVGWTSQSLLNITETGSAHPQEVKNDV